MSQKPTRRSFLKGAGVALTGLMIPTVSASSSEDRYIIDLQSTTESDLAGLDIVHRLDQIDIAVVKGDDAQVSGTRYSKDVDMKVTFPEVEHHGDEHERHKRMKDPLYWLQWDKQAQNVPRVHRKTRGERTRVSVIDTGIFEGHPDLEAALNTDLSMNLTDDDGDFNPADIDDADHGTHCGGIIAADDGNGEGVVGTAPGTDLVALRVFSEDGATFGDIVAAMEHSAKIESDVANMSIGAYPLPRDAEVAVLRDAIERAASYANEQGTLMVAAAGNDSANLDGDGDVISLPNEADNVMSISATGPIGYRWDDESEERNYHAALRDLREPTYEPAFYTNYGPEAVDISAPGGNADQSQIGTDSKWYYDLVLSTVFTEEDGERVADYGWKAGTSMASPTVAAVAALVKSVNPDATPGEIRQHLEDTARDRHNPTYHGEGHLDTKRAVWRRIWNRGHGHDHGHGHEHEDDYGHNHGHGNDHEERDD